MKIVVRVSLNLLSYFLCFATASVSHSQDIDQILLIDNASIVDVIDGKIVPNMSILVRDGKIETIAAAGQLELPGDVTVVDATGKFAIPGLWDMHIHWYDQKTMALFPINGVTGVRVMWGGPMHHAWKAKFQTGEQLGPRSNYDKSA